MSKPLPPYIDSSNPPENGTLEMELHILWDYVLYMERELKALIEERK